MVFAVRTHHYAKHKMWPVATDEVNSQQQSMVCLSVCVCVSVSPAMSPVKTAEPDQSRCCLGRGLK